jgi:hypothetical protein
MRRKSFDAIASAAGLVLAAVLLAASGLLFWAHSFVDDNVRTQLTAQKIFMPTAGSDQLNDPAVKPYLSKYAGQQVVNGAQAQAFADHYIKVHLAEATGNRTYSELSAAARTQPDNAELQGLVQTSFRGETLRGLLLNAYAFWKMGQVALYAAWIAVSAGALLVLLSMLGLVHAKRTSYDTKVHVPGWHPENATAS